MNQPLLSEVEGQRKVISSAAEVTSSIEDSRHICSHSADQASCSAVKAKSHVRMANDLSNISRCESCQKSCVMCILQRAQREIETAVKEMGKAKCNTQFCYCQAHIPTYHSTCSEDV